VLLIERNTPYPPNLSKIKLDRLARRSATVVPSLINRKTNSPLPAERSVQAAPHKAISYQFNRMNTRNFSAKVCLLAVVGWAGVVSATAAAVNQARLPKAATRAVTFEAEVKPLLERSCAQCHSGEKPKGKFSVESREGLLKGGESKEAAVVVGNSAASPLVNFVAGLVAEMEMPPVEKQKKFPSLSAEEIGVVRAWIDQGAKWPEGMKLTIPVTLAEEPAKGGNSNERAAAKHDAIFDLIRAGDRKAIAKASKNPGTLNLRDEEGNTPLIQAAFYLEAADVARLIAAGADVNATNNAGLTALMKGVWDLEKTRVLIQHHANVNAASKMGSTPLIIASFAYGSSGVVKELITAGAELSAANGVSDRAVTAAAEAGDVNTLRILLEHGGSPDSKTIIQESSSQASALMIAAQMGHMDCVKLLLERGANVNLTTEHGNALAFAAFTDRKEIARLLLDRGADVNVTGRRIVSFRNDTGFTPLMYACLSERNDSTLVKWLIERGADLNVKASSGETALAIARQRGNTKIVAALGAAGTKEEVAKSAAGRMAPLSSGAQLERVDAKVARKAAEAGVAVLVKSGARMTEATGNRCSTCHQQSIPAVAWSYAREKGFEYPKELVHGEMSATISGSKMFESISSEMPLPVPNIASWFLIGMDAAGHRSDAMTDKFAYTLARYQYGDGRWVTKAARPPTDYSDVTSTAAAIRALSLYAPPTLKKRMDAQVARAATWLSSCHAESTEERAMQILGLSWAGRSKSETEKLAAALLAEQRADGGWAQLATLESDAYATGLALYALKQAGVNPSANAVYQRGVKFLVKNQEKDGSWRVATRASAIQVAIDDIFPHGKDQWISSVATGWSSMALMYACESRTNPRKIMASK
jgi:ankyrin repeat protein